MVSALDHKTELKNVKDATCTEAGYTGDEVCTVCKQTIKSGAAIEKVAHTWDDGVAHCVNNGMMNGVGDGKFDPDGTLTRAMVSPS